MCDASACGVLTRNSRFRRQKLRDARAKINSTTERHREPGGTPYRGQGFSETLLLQLRRTIFRIPRCKSPARYFTDSLWEILVKIYNLLCPGCLHATADGSSRKANGKTQRFELVLCAAACEACQAGANTMEIAVYRCMYSTDGCLISGAAETGIIMQGKAF